MSSSDDDTSQGLFITKRRNQHLPAPPITIIRDSTLKYWRMRKTDKDITKLLVEDGTVDTSKYGLSVKTFRKLRTEMGLNRARTTKYTPETIRPIMEQLRARWPKAGAREMKNIAFHEANISVARSVIEQYFKRYEPDLLKERIRNRLRRKRFWAAGVFDLISVDQHDKWKKKFRLALHMGLDPFSGWISWLKIWWTNSNPRLILGYYLDSIEEYGYMPMITQSDPGTENYGIANGHTLLRHMQDPRLEGTLQHRMMSNKKNIPPEIGWSQLRRRWSPGFEDLLDFGVNENLYDPDDPLQHLVFRYVFIPYLQKELDMYRARLNNTARRSDRNKVLPHGPPNDILNRPDAYGALHFGVVILFATYVELTAYTILKISVNKEHIETVRVQYAPCHHPVFDLVPKAFKELADRFYNELNRPVVSWGTAWTVYDQLLAAFLEFDGEFGIPESIEHWEAFSVEHIDLIDAEPLVDINDSSEGVHYRYLGGVRGGRGLDEAQEDVVQQAIERDEGTEMVREVAQELAEEDEVARELSEESPVNQAYRGLAVLYSSDEDAQDDIM